MQLQNPCETQMWPPHTKASNTAAHSHSQTHVDAVMHTAIRQTQALMAPHKAYDLTCSHPLPLSQLVIGHAVARLPGPNHRGHASQRQTTLPAWPQTSDSEKHAPCPDRHTDAASVGASQTHHTKRQNMSGATRGGGSKEYKSQLRAPTKMVM